jgi:hypothetical protein
MLGGKTLLNLQILVSNGRGADLLKTTSVRRKTKVELEEDTKVRQ